jgi:hypothetical protein
MSRTQATRKGRGGVVLIYSLRPSTFSASLAVNPTSESLTAETGEDAKVAQRTAEIQTLGKSIERARIFIATDPLDDYQARF